MNQPVSPDSPAGPFPIVGIGASAGGLEAVSELLAALPADTGMAFVLVQHLDPGHASMLAEILAKKTSMPVAEAREGVAPEANSIYVIPPNTQLALSGAALHLTSRESGGRNPTPIDTLFRSLAAERGRGAIGVLLSGTGSDGTRGAQAIKEAAGIVFAQDPESAPFDSMPRSAIAAGAVDMVLRPADLARRLAGLAGHLAAGHAGEDEAAAAEADEEDTWKRIFRLLRGASGIDFTHYKRSTLRRRVARRQALQRLPELARYVELLGQDDAELEALSRDALIGVTGFFRDPESFEALARTVFPALFEGRAPREALRIWVPGCSSGEELYSIAICLMEHLGGRAGRTPVQLFGTDASEAAVTSARAGIYPDGIEAEVSRERLERWFVKRDDHYQIARSIRDLCVFARHDVTRDPPFSRVDLVSCRNLLIYLDAALQRQVMHQFHYALRPRGFLLLGPAEAIGQNSDLFELIDKKRRVFTRKDAPRGVYVQGARHPEPRPAYPAAPAGRGGPYEEDRVQRETDRLLLARYAPAAIVVDDDLNVLQFRGHTAAYLEHGPGAASLNLQQLAPASLVVALKPALREARSTRATVRRDGLRIEAQGRERLVRLEVTPFRQQDDAPACSLVVLEEAQPARARFWEKLLEAAARRAPAPGGAAGEVEQLKAELAATREFLKSSAEEHEAAKEELKSLHEESLSANEEFQSTNEELETAKEELQSSNEELATTNDELRTRNQELLALNEAMEHARDLAEAIVETVRHPLLLLDNRLRVLRANSAFYRLFKVEPRETEKQHLYDLGNRQWDIPQLRILLEKTLVSTDSVEDYHVTHQFEAIGARAMMLNARRLLAKAGESEMILLGIEDATERLAASDSLKETDRRKDELLAMLGHELRNPLAPIRSAVELMRGRKIEDPALRQCVEILDRQSGQMVRLVDDLLEVTRFTRGELLLDLEELDLADAVDRAVEATRPLLESRRHRLKLGRPPRSMRVRGDLVRLTQIFTNLLNNAAKYTPAQGKIEISFEPGETHAAVAVADSGQGISAELLPRIFEPFGQRAGLTRTGLGIGLPLSRRLAALHGGSVEARSDGPGKGSTFVVRLPLLVPVRGLEPRAAGVARADAPAATPTHELQGCRVLIVDDNVDAAQTLEMFLKLVGCEVRLAYDGASTLPLAEQFRPEVVLLDLALPDIDGYEVLRRLRASLRVKPAVIALSGFAQPADLVRIGEAGFDLSLRKPVASVALAAAIASVRKSLS